MCWCTPTIRTPHCGKTGCIPPQSNTFAHGTVVPIDQTAMTVPSTSVGSPYISIELDAASVHLAHGNVIYKSQAEAMLTGLQEFCRANGVIVDRYRIRIEAVTFPRTPKS